MPLHYKTIESAVKKYRDKTGDVLRAALRADANNYTDADIAQIEEAITKDIAGSAGSQQLQAPPKVEQTTSPLLKDSGASPNAAIADKLARFDYNNLKGESFKQYCLLVQSLNLAEKYDFELYPVTVVKRERYRGVKDTPVDTVGFTLNNTRPIHTTRIPVKHALSMNGRVEPFRGPDGTPEEMGFETIGCQLDHNGSNGRYYLLKKVS